MFPVHEVHFALYLQHLAVTTQSKATIKTAVNAVAWVSQFAGQSNISKSPFICATLSGLQHQLAAPSKKKEPITAQMLARMVDSVGESPTVADSRLLALAFLSFSAFLRFDELSHLCCSDIVFEEDKMLIHIASSRTDQWREGAFVPVARSGTNTCLVKILEQYYSLGNIDNSYSERLFRALVSTKNGCSLRKSGSLTCSYTRMRELVRDKLSSLGYDASQYGLHSFRAGCATAAANSGVPDRLFKRHGRWRSENAKDGYIKDCMASRLALNKSLRL